MNKHLKRFLIGIGILFLLLKGMEWWVELRFQKIINRKADRAYDIRYNDFNVHSFFKGVTLKEVSIVPVAVDSGTVINGTVDYARLQGLRWYELAFAKRLNIQGLLFEKPTFVVTLSKYPKKRKSSGKGFQELLSDIISRANLSRFEIDNGSVRIMAPENESMLGQLSDLNVKANEIVTDSVIWNHLIPFKLGSLESSIDSLSYQLNDYTHLSTGRIYFKKRDNRLTLEDVDLHYTEDLKTVSQKVGQQTDLMQIQLGELTFENLTAGSDLYTDLDIETKKIFISDLVFKDYRDKNMPRPPDVEKPMFQGMVDAIPITLSVDTIHLNNVTVEYSELGEGKDKAGTISFVDIDGFITRLTTIPQKKEAYQSFEANLNASLNGVADLTFDLEVPYDQEAFTAIADIKSFDMTRLNETARDMAGAEIVSGDIKKIRFEMYASKSSSHNKMQFDYENLKINLISENKHHEVKNHPFFSALANSALRNDNVPTHGKYKTADYYSQRNIYRGPFNFMWQSLADGMLHIVPGGFIQSIIGVDKESKKVKKQNKKKAKKESKS